MADLRGIRRRIGSIRNVRKLSDAMKMVSTAKFWKYQTSLDKARAFTDELEVMLSHAALHVPKKEVTKTIDLVLTSDRGMCGAFNHVLLRSVSPSSPRYVIGKKGNDFFRSEGSCLERDTSFWDDFTSSSINNLYSKLLKLAAENNCDGIAVNYMAFSSFVSQKPSKMLIYPCYPDAPAGFHEVDIEPNPAAFFEEAIHLYGKALLKQVIFENLVSENAARMGAMDNASRNAGELIEKLKIKYNRLRQDAITVELMEIIGGTEALNE
ncbi:ATP synthase F1 subunit gamma [Myxococcota bacterium]|nr:ATP synthase F1 subunit gamma [Myxococcota bacterium]MBU1382562.1 ATP synthase F1 subunit gamma [Myxococcota bacterium]MBU1496081.1 ATP synthase F1 subunit gamma [Myxococcota bacterium]